MNHPPSNDDVEAVLKDCPFCGCHASVREADSEGPYWIECEMCGVRGADHEWQVNAASAWNFRFADVAAIPTQPKNEQPIDMVLFCPECGLQHIDEPDERTPEWTNPPHKSHLCHGCGTIWRPADIPTNGVAAIQTRGKADTIFPDHSAPKNEDGLREALDHAMLGQFVMQYEEGEAGFYVDAADAQTVALQVKAALGLGSAIMDEIHGDLSIPTEVACKVFSAIKRANATLSHTEGQDHE